ncbi:hypothetical protein FGO68_gene16507 [Halteria grandinella]|uniref:RING-type domain-containing protein n=1 Tax=Halteria grandinella TaxID=5974 RepID=A0A8J8SU93_HALGN|nr:hypothetical protein FGO68_gene16507 [Halteria grandinella]
MTELTEVSHSQRKVEQSKSTEASHSQLQEEESKESNGGDYLLLSIPDDAHSNNYCVICIERERDSIFYPCGHECVCHKCGQQFMKQAVQKICPICRNRIKDIVKVYR